MKDGGSVPLLESTWVEQAPCTPEKTQGQEAPWSKPEWAGNFSPSTDQCLGTLTEQDLLEDLHGTRNEVNLEIVRGLATTLSLAGPDSIRPLTFLGSVVPGSQVPKYLPPAGGEKGRERGLK